MQWSTNLVKFGQTALPPWVCVIIGHGQLLQKLPHLYDGVKMQTRVHRRKYRRRVSDSRATDLHEVEAGHFIDGSVRDDAVLLGIHNSWADEAGEQQVRAHGAHLAHLEALHARQSLVHLRHNPAQAVGEAVGVLLQVTDELVNQGDQLGFIRINSGLHAEFVSFGALLSKVLLLGWSEAFRHLGRISLQMIFVFDQQLHDGLVKGGCQEDLGRVEALGKQLEQDAEGARSSPQQAAGVVALLQLKLYQISQDLERMKEGV